MLFSIATPTELQQRINSLFLYLKPTILKLNKKHFNYEDFYGKGKELETIFLTYISLLYIVLLYNDLKTNPDNLKILELYDIEKYRKCLSCKHISLDKMIENFGGLPINDSKVIEYFFALGLNQQELEFSFIVEPSNTYYNVPENLEDIVILRYNTLNNITTFLNPFN